MIRLYFGGMPPVLALIMLVFAESPAGAQKVEIIKLAKQLAKGEEPDKVEIAKLAKADIEDVMNIFKLPRGAAKTGGIEVKFRGIGKKPMAANEIADQVDDLLTAAQQTTIVGRVMLARPAPKGAGKNAADWKKWSQDLIDGSDDLAKALKKKDPKDILTAVKNVNASCANCHGVFRD